MDPSKIYFPERCVDLQNQCEGQNWKPVNSVSLEIVETAWQKAQVQGNR